MFRWMKKERKENKKKIVFYCLIEQKCKRKEKNLMTNDNFDLKQMYVYSFFLTKIEILIVMKYIFNKKLHIELLK